MYCNKCGAELSDGARFCTACGNEVKHRTAIPDGDYTVAIATGLVDFSDNRGSTTVSVPKKLSKKKIAIIVAIVVVLLVAAGVGIWYLVDQHNKAIWEEEHKTYPVEISILSEGYDPESSSPVPVLIEGSDFENNPVSVEALVGTAGCEQVALMRGDYTITVTASPFLADGGMFDVSSAQGQFEVAGEGETGQGSVSVPMTPLAPSDVTEEVITASKDKLVSLGFDESEAAQYADAASKQANEAQRALRLADAKAQFSSQLSQILKESDNDWRSGGNTQQMREWSSETYAKEDALLNEVVQFYSESLSESERTSFSAEQNTWSKQREEAMDDAYWEGSGGDRTQFPGTIAPLNRFSEGCEWTEARIRTLLDRF